MDVIRVMLSNDVYSQKAFYRCLTETSGTLSNFP